MPLPPPLVPTYKVLVNGAQLPIDLRLSVTKVTVEIDRNLPGLFQLEVTGLDFTEEHASLFPGSTVEIQLGRDINHLERIIKGEILGLEPQFTCDRAFRLLVWGCDHLHRLQRGTKTRTFLKATDSAIAHQIATEAGLVVNVTNSQTKHEYVMQANQTDLQFLQQRAQQIGYELFIGDATLFFQPILKNSSFPQQLTLGEDLLEFYPRFSVVPQVTQVTVKGWDMQTKQAISQNSSQGKFTALEASSLPNSSRGETFAKKLGAAEVLITDRPVNTTTAQQIAQAQIDQTALELITGEGSCFGNPKILPGTTVLINGLDQKFGGTHNFGGKYYITGVTHRFDEEGYFTDFRVKRNTL